MEQSSLFESIWRADTPEAFIDFITGYDHFGRTTSTEEVEGITYFSNEYWTSRQRKAHSLHEISYRACFKAQLPEFFIHRLTDPGDVVHDPFMGRGTTPLQTALMDRRPIGNDINPLSILLSRPRLRPISLADVKAALNTVDWESGKIEREDLLAFYHPVTLRRLEALRLWLARQAPIERSDPDPVADWIRMVAINRLSGHSPGFFSGRSMPPNQAVSVAAQQKINSKLGLDPPERDIASILLKKSESLLRDDCLPHQSRASLYARPAWDTPDIAAESVDLVVTSPPFLDVVQYAADNWLRCWFADIDPDSIAIDSHKTGQAWETMVRRVLGEQARILRPGGYIAFEVGEVRGGAVLLERLVWRAAEGLPFDRLGVMVNDQDFTKTANCWGVVNGTKGTNTNRVVLLQRV